ncbi:DUF4928 family protein [Bifidobacterium oedipodis]|uniref:DUF4928 domain-containing protein n=1 Tax=Bifidobacterium oedipodis TaxID=2675322 RepID=A0A7Y0HU21_9BIFI|nr:DUF4928 family protein [Bifidobacterium sp. DSM 109957]NMM94697.1 hypothetical protein [Bifidobacterium sp. DSM 109957]
MDLHHLNEFCIAHNVAETKGALAAALQLTRLFSKDTLPINPENYLTDKEGQIKGLSGSRLKQILSEHGMNRRFVSEGGRTNRGNMSLMRDYAVLINAIAPSEQEFAIIEQYWVDRILDFLNRQPLKLEADNSLSISTAIDHLLQQATKRQQGIPGATYTGTVLQQLVAAKLSSIIENIEINGASTADTPTGRDGDFNVGDTAIHCTTAPGSLLIEKCKHNINDGLHPIIVTIRERTNTAYTLAADAGIAENIEVWDIQSFLSTNIHEHGRFDSASRHASLSKLIATYNRIIDEQETDPSLRIEYNG